MTKDKITDEYIKAVQKQFKHYHAADTRFISDLKDAVISYAAQQDSLDYEQLVSQFVANHGALTSKAIHGLVYHFDSSSS